MHTIHPPKRKSKGFTLSLDVPDPSRRTAVPGKRIIADRRTKRFRTRAAQNRAALGN